jgi:hypothetical protein
LIARRAGRDAAEPMPLSLPVGLLHIAAVAVMLAVIDWSLKTSQIELRPDQVVFNTDRPWQVIPLGIPFRGAVWSPADLFLAAGLVLLWIGAAQYPRARALQARDPLHGRRRRSRRQGDALPGDS